MPRILVVDDDPHIRDVIRFALEKAGMRVVTVADGGCALDAFSREPVDLIVLDIGMPELDGLDVCRQIRRTSEVPILFLSARDEEIDRVLGLEIGGDDYVTKPFSPRELVTRINVILKRTRSRPPQDEVRALVRGPLVLDLVGYRVTFDDKPVTLTALEFAIMKVFAARPNQVFNRDQILDAAYAGTVHVSDRTIDSHIRNIRSKLSQAGCDQAIETVHGIGFRLGSCEIS
jgi:two-component system OmpR family response regulator